MRKITFIFFVVIAMCAMTASAQFTNSGKSSVATNGRTIPTGFHQMVEIGYGIDVSGRERYDGKLGRVEISMVEGYQFNPYFFAGAGAMLNIFTNSSEFEDKPTGWSVPVFGAFRLSIPTESAVTPFFDARIGYSVGDISGFYFSPAVGVRYAISRKTGINFSIGYELQKAPYGYKYDWDDDGYKIKNWEYMNAGAVTLKLGIDF